MSQPATRVSTNLLHIIHIHWPVCTFIPTHTRSQSCDSNTETQHTHFLSSPVTINVILWLLTFGFSLLPLSLCHSIHTDRFLSSSIPPSFLLHFLRPCPFSPRCHNQFSTSSFPSRVLIPSPLMSPRQRPFSPRSPSLSRFFKRLPSYPAGSNPFHVTCVLLFFVVTSVYSRYRLLVLIHS